MRKHSLKALLFVLVASLVLCLVTACEVVPEKTKLEAPTLAEKVYTGSKLTATIAESEGYTVVTNEGGTDVGEYEVVLKLSDETKYEWATPDADDATKVTLKFVVTKANNEITVLTLDGWTFGQDANIPTATAMFGTPTFTYGATADGEFSETVPTAAGNYFVKATVAATANYDGAEKTAEFKIARASAALTTTPQAVTNLVYMGGALDLVTAGVANGGTMQYKLGTDGTWSSDIPTATNAGEYTVYYKVLGDDSHSDIAEASVSVVVAKAKSTFGKLPQDPDLHYTGDMQALLIAGETACGKIWYKLGDGEWTVEIPSATDAKTYDVYYKIVGDGNHNDLINDETQKISVTIARVNAVVTAPTAKTDLAYNGEAQALVNAGSANGATIEYKLDNGEWTKDVPSATNAGEYTVYYKFVADANHNVVETEQEITVTIAKVAAEVTAPTAKTDLTYNGEAQALVNAGSASGATIEYKLGDGEWTTDVPSATNAGTYSVTYKAVPDSNHTSEVEQTIEVTIAKATATFKTEPTAVENLVYSGEALTLVVAGESDNGTIMYKLSDGEWTSELPAAVNAGVYSVSYKIDVDSNHVAPAEKSLSVTIAKQQKTVNVEETKRVRVELDINNDGTLNSNKTIDVDLAGAIGDNNYTVVAVKGNDVVDNIVTADLFGYAYGNTTVEIVAETANYGYTINLPMLLVSKVVKTVDDYTAWVVIANKCEEGGHTFGGYFELGNDIVADNGTITMVYLDKGAWDGVEGFVGTFDGCGYVIDGLVNANSEEYANFIGGLGANGVLKNIGFTNAVKSGVEAFLARTRYGTIENVYVKYKEINTASGKTITLRNSGADVTVNNVFVDASNATFADGSKFCVISNALVDSMTVYAIVPNGFCSYEGDASGYGHGFESFKKLKEHENAWPTVQKFTTSSEYWHVNSETGRVGFGKNYVEPQLRQEKITVPDSNRIRAELDINNNGTLNANKVIDIDIASLIDTNAYWLTSVNGNDVSSNTVTANLFGYAYGNKNITIVAETDDAVYTINLPMLLVSKVIRTVDDYAAWGKIAMACENNGAVSGSHNYGGYFELGNDITSESGSIAMVYADENAWDGAGGFSGTFDGCGYSIDGLVANVAKDHATFIGEMKAGAVLKNIGFTNVSMSGITFLTRTTNGTVSNIYVQYKKIAVASGQTILARDKAVVQNVFVDASAAEIVSGSAYGILGSDHAREKGYGIYGIVPSGFVSFVYNGGNGCGHGFASSSLLKSDTEAWPAVQGFATDCEYWHVNAETGEVTFGR